MKIKGLVSVFLLLAMQVLFAAPALCDTTVDVLHIPDGGIQPQAHFDQSGNLHLLYYKGDAKTGNLFYVKRSPGKGEFPAPIQVNSTPNSACAMGTIRGGQLALGRAGQVYVVWNASKALPDHTHKLLFSRLNKERSAFEAEKNLMNASVDLDGGSTLAADGRGNVYVFIHAFKKGEDECKGRIFMSKSSDDGATFSAQTSIDQAERGTCACCGMKAIADDAGHLYVLYRAASDNTNRDTMLLRSTDSGKSFQSKKLDSWNLNACPLTAFGLASNANRTVMGWESRGKVKFCSDPGSSPVSLGESSKYPTIAVNKRGETLCSWTEGAGWGSGGNACWQIFDAKQKPLSKLVSRAGVASWSFTTALAAPDGKFLLIY